MTGSAPWAKAAHPSAESSAGRRPFIRHPGKNITTISRPDYAGTALLRIEDELLCRSLVEIFITLGRVLEEITEALTAFAI
jgi:hypothetical protein